MRTITTIVAALACFVAAYSMFCIKGGGEGPTIFESAFKACGWYFIAKGIFFISKIFPFEEEDETEAKPEPKKLSWF